MKIEKMEELVQVVIKDNKKEYADIDECKEKIKTNELENVEGLKFKLTKRGNSYHLLDFELLEETEVA